MLRTAKELIAKTWSTEDLIGQLCITEGVSGVCQIIGVNTRKNRLTVVSKATGRVDDIYGSDLVGFGYSILSDGDFNTLGLKRNRARKEGEKGKTIAKTALYEKAKRMRHELIKMEAELLSMALEPNKNTVPEKAEA